MSVFNLKEVNFALQGTQKKFLGLNVAGNIVVLYKSEQCQFCMGFKPAYVQLSKEFPDIKFTVLDVDQYRSVIAQSKQTGHPVQRVPSIFFYSNGRPMAKYNGDVDYANVQRFIKEMQTQVSGNNTGGSAVGGTPIGSSTMFGNSQIGTGNGVPKTFMNPPNIARPVETSSASLATPYAIPHNNRWMADIMKYIDE